MNTKTPKPLLTYYLFLVFVSSILNHFHQVSSDVPKQQFSESKPLHGVSEAKTLKPPVLSNPTCPHQVNFSSTSASASASTNLCGEENVPSSSSPFPHSQISNKPTARFSSSWKESSPSSPAEHSQVIYIDRTPFASPSQFPYPATSSGAEDESSVSAQYPAPVPAPTTQNSTSPGQVTSGNISSRKDKRLFRYFKPVMESLNNLDVWLPFFVVSVSIVIAIVVSSTVETIEMHMALILLTFAFDCFFGGLLLRTNPSVASDALLTSGTAFMIFGIHAAIASRLRLCLKLISYLFGLVILIGVLVVIAHAPNGEEVKEPAVEEKPAVKE